MSKEVPVCSIIGCPNSEKDTVKSTVYYHVPKEHFRARYWGRVLKGFIGDTPLLQGNFFIYLFFWIVQLFKKFNT